MTRQRTIIVGISFLAVGAFLFASFVLQHHSPAARDSSASSSDAFVTFGDLDQSLGTDFRVQHVAVRAAYRIGPLHARSGDPITVDLQFGKTEDGPDLDDAADGSLQSELIATDCTVTVTSPDSYSTTAEIPESMRWSWLITDCSKATTVARLNLTFRGPAGVPKTFYTASQIVHAPALSPTSSSPAASELSADLLQWLTVISTLLGIIATLKGLLTRKEKSADPEAGR